MKSSHSVRGLFPMRFLLSTGQIASLIFIAIPLSIGAQTTAVPQGCQGLEAKIDQWSSNLAGWQKIHDSCLQAHINGPHGPESDNQCSVPACQQSHLYVYGTQVKTYQAQLQTQLNACNARVSSDQRLTNQANDLKDQYSNQIDLSGGMAIVSDSSTLGAAGSAAAAADSAAADNASGIDIGNSNIGSFNPTPDNLAADAAAYQAKQNAMDTAPTGQSQVDSQAYSNQEQTFRSDPADDFNNPQSQSIAQHFSAAISNTITQAKTSVSNSLANITYVFSSPACASFGISLKQKAKNFFNFDPDSNPPDPNQETGCSPPPSWSNSTLNWHTDQPNP